MTETVGDWQRLLDGLYPRHHAAEWDHVGLQVGDPDWPVERVLVTLDVTSAVVAEAAEEPATLLVAHHPVLFRPLRALTPATATGRVALAAAGSRVAITAAHTNLDVARDGAGTSDPIARVLSLVDVHPLAVEVTEARDAKLVTFVPPAALERVLDAVSAAGAGRIGAYERCSFRVRGTGTFRPLDGAEPWSGRIGEDAAEEEDRLEIVVPRSRVAAVVRALVASHPYDEVAYDLLPLLDGAERGFGVVGDLPEPLTLSTLAARIRADLPAPHLRYAGAPDDPVRRIAAVGGAGDGLIGAALAAGADVYVTGDLRHHVTLDALEAGLALVDAGHHATEVAAMPWLCDRLAAEAAAEGLQAAVVASRTPTVPWR